MKDNNSFNADFGFYDFTAGNTSSLEVQQHQTLVGQCCPNYDPANTANKAVKIIPLTSETRQNSLKVIHINHNGGLNLGSLPSQANNSLISLNSKVAKSSERFKFSVVKKSNELGGINGTPSDESKMNGNNGRQSKFKISRISKSHISGVPCDLIRKNNFENSDLTKNGRSIHIEFTPTPLDDQDVPCQPRMANSYERKPFDDLIDIF